MNFLDRFQENPQISNFINIHPVGAELFHADRRTDMAKLIAASRNFANAPKISTCHIFGSFQVPGIRILVKSVCSPPQTFFIRRSTTTVQLQTTSTDLADGFDELFQCFVPLHLKTVTFFVLTSQQKLKGVNLEDCPSSGAK